MTSRVPPQNLEAERAILGAMLTDPSVVGDVAAVIEPGDFYFDSHRRVFESILALFNWGEAVDVITVDAALRCETGQRLLAAELCQMAELALPSHAVHYARLVREAAHRRRLIEIFGQAQEDTYTPHEEPVALAGRVSAELSSLGIRTGGTFKHVSEVTTDVVKDIEKAATEKRQLVGIPTGFKDVDEKLGGFHRQDLIIIAGRPSMGKTALGATIAVGAAERGYPVAFVSAESPARKIGRRLLAAASGIENRDLLRGKIDGRIGELVAAAGRVGALPLWLLEAERSWARIQAKLRAFKFREPRLALAIIDYIGLLSAPVPRGERYLELGKISSEAKALALELDLAVILLSQLNREVEARTDKRPRLSDLRESGCLEQDADVVGLLYRPSYYDPNFTPYDLAALDVAKNRDGATGVIRLRFDEQTVSFSDSIEAEARDFRTAQAGNGGR